MHIYHIGLRIEMIVPDIFEKHGARHDMPGVAHEIFKQLELAGLEGNSLAAACHGAGEINSRSEDFSFVPERPWELRRARDLTGPGVEKA